VRVVVPDRSIFDPNTRCSELDSGRPSSPAARRCGARIARPARQWPKAVRLLSWATVGDDGLPGLDSSQTMRLERIVTSEDLLHRRRREIRDAGSLGAYARQHGASKGAVANVEGCTHDVTAGVAALMGMARVTNLWVPVARRGGHDEGPRV
jgi:predicted pyridoxine 5'-phosphate oxidase superfamily flavin-nucleotide-binding protein